MELKPCPFCGSKPEDEPVGSPGFMTYLYFVRCGNPDCGAEGVKGVDHATAWKRWNHRASTAPEPGDERNRLTQIFLKCARFKIYIDGNKWCATFDDFENLQESPVGFGDDEYEAVVALLEDFK